MNIILYIVIVLIKILIWIGDVVLLLIKGVTSALNKIILWLLKIIDFARKRFVSFLSHVRWTVRLKINHTISNITSSLHSWRIKRAQSPRKEIPILIVKKHYPFKKNVNPSIPFLLKIKYLTIGAFFSSIFIFIPLLFFIFLQDLPNPKVMAFQDPSQTTKIYDRKGKLLYQIYASENRTIVPLSSIPKFLQQATIAIEDKDFYKHPGFDILAIIRSIRENASGKSLQGGSTITQQLMKSTLLTPETSIQRKVKEIILAFWAERLYSKNQILEMYFNQIPYGGTAWGIEAASEVYFGKHVKDLTLSESTFLAGMPKAPTIYSPFGTTPNLWKKRQKEVLDRMVAVGFISREQAEKTAKEELNFQTTPTPIHAPHFVMYVKDLLVKKYGLPLVEKGGLTITTSLDSDLQGKVQKIVTDEVNNNAPLNLTNGAALVTSPSTGDILAMVGSRDFSDPQSGNVNLTTALRQPGSSIKIVTYSAALSNGLTAATILDDSPVSYSIAGSYPYAPVNYDGKFHGRVPLRMALGNSFNIPAVKVLNQLGVPTMVNYGKSMGISSWKDPSNYGLSITLGAAEVNMVDLSTVYGVLANGGYRINTDPIIKVTNQEGEVLEDKQNLSKPKILDEGVAFILSDILADNNARSMEFGPRSPLFIPNHTVSVKTGTSDNKRDNWTIGYVSANEPSLLVAAWVGNNDNSPMSPNLASGITGAAPIWNKIMTMLLKDVKDQKPTIPSDVIQKPCLGRNEFFVRGTETSASCTPLPTWTPTPSPAQ